MIHKIMDIYIILKNEKYVKYMNSSSLNDISKTKIGLHNLGNTCDMYTTLQINFTYSKF